MRSRGPKGLISLEAETVLSRQVRQLRQTFRYLGKIIVVAGFQADRVREQAPEGVVITENRSYEDTNVAYSIALGMRKASSAYTLVIYGDLVFNREILQQITPGKSAVIVGDERRDDEVGVNVVDGKVTHFSFGLPTKWSQIILFHPRERQLFLEIASEKHRAKYFGYEILNEVLNRGGEFMAIQPDPIYMAEIDSTKDISVAVQLSLSSN